MGVGNTGQCSAPGSSSDKTLAGVSCDASSSTAATVQAVTGIASASDSSGAARPAVCACCCGGWLPLPGCDLNSVGAASHCSDRNWSSDMCCPRRLERPSSCDAPTLLLPVLQSSAALVLARVCLLPTASAVAASKCCCR